MRHFETVRRYQWWTAIFSEAGLSHIYVSDRAALAQASDLLSDFGEMAELEAASRADRSRALGNIRHFCHWRQIGRTIGMLRGEHVTGTVH